MLCVCVLQKGSAQSTQFLHGLGHAVPVHVVPMAQSTPEVSSHGPVHTVPEWRVHGGQLKPGMCPTNQSGNSILVCDSSAKEREPCSVNPLWTWTWPHSRRIYDGDQPHCWWTAGPINVVAILTEWVRGDHFMEANKIHGPCNQFILMGMTINFIFCQGLPGTCLYKNIKK